MASKHRLGDGTPFANQMLTIPLTVRKRCSPETVEHMKREDGAGITEKVHSDFTGCTPSQKKGSPQDIDW